MCSYFCSCCNMVILMFCKTVCTTDLDNLHCGRKIKMTQNNNVGMIEFTHISNFNQRWENLGLCSSSFGWDSHLWMLHCNHFAWFIAECNVGLYGISTVTSMLCIGFHRYLVGTKNPLPSGYLKFNKFILILNFRICFTYSILLLWRP
jgi:hypothetical protein